MVKGDKKKVIEAVISKMASWEVFKIHDKQNEGIASFIAVVQKAPIKKNG